MIPSDIAFLALVIAFVLAVYGLATGAYGSWLLANSENRLYNKLRGDLLVRSSQHAVFANAFLVTLASGFLFWALFTHDFRIAYVAQTSSRDMSPSYLFTSFWGGQAGSLLFWAWMLTIFSAIAVWHARKNYPELAPYVGSVLLGIEVFFLLLLSFVSNPFERLAVEAVDGQGLNPLLMDPGMRFHPPFLLTGYMSFSIPFAYAIAALLTGRLGKEWLLAIRRWMLVGWLIQGIGLLIGAWWAYHVLGWGGYWGWDPVENAALMPWLTATAFIHSTMVQERRGMLKVWNLGLVVLTFLLAIFGTFIVRSGVISSVHAFALSSLGPFFFTFLGIATIFSLGLIFFRLPKLKTEGRFDSLLSKEASFLMNNLLILGITFATFWGTIFPLISEVVRGAKVSVGPPFFKQVNGPLFLLLILLIGFGTLLAWRRSSGHNFIRNLALPAVSGMIVGSLLFLLDVRKFPALLSFSAIVFVFVATCIEFYKAAAARSRNTSEPFAIALVNIVRRNRRRYGGYIVHLAMLLLAVGITASSFYQYESTRTLQKGQSMSVDGYTITSNGLYVIQRPSVQVIYADLSLRHGQEYLGNIRPEKRIYKNWEDQPVTGVAIKTLFPNLDDIYVLISDIDQNGNATIRVFINPMVALIWWGGVLFVIGTLICAWPQARRSVVRQRSTATEALVNRVGANVQA